MSEEHKKKLTIIAGILLVGLILVVGTAARQAQANAFTDFFGKLFSPLNVFQVAPSSTAVPVPLYQPAVDYEQAVVALDRADA